MAVVALVLLSCDSRKPAVTPNRELYELFEADQAERREALGNLDWSAIGPRDEARRQRARQLIDSGALHAPEDYYRAAMLFQHGTTASDVRLARELA